MFFGIIGILENSAFLYSVEKGRSPLISKKISGFEGEKNGFCVFLAFKPIFGGVLFIGGDKMVTSKIRAVFPNSLI